MHHTLSDTINRIINSTANLTRQETTKWISQSEMSPDSVAQVFLGAVKTLLGSGKQEHALRLLYPLLEAAKDTKSREMIFGLMNTVIFDDEAKRELIIDTIQTYLYSDDWSGLYEFLTEHSSEIEHGGISSECSSIIKKRADELTRSTYEHNLELIRQSSSLAYHKLQNQLNDYGFFVLPRTTKNSSFLDVGRLEGGKIVWLTGDGTPEEGATRFSSGLRQIEIDGNASAIGIIGIRSQLEIDKLMEFTRITGVGNVLGIKLPLYIIEPNIALFKAMMRIWRLDSLIEPERLLFFIGPDAIEDLKGYLMADNQSSLPQICINLSESSKPNPIFNQLEVLAREKESRTIETRTKVQQYYKSASAVKWRNIYRCKGRPLRVMGIQSRFTTFVKYCMRDLLDGFARIGCHTTLMIEGSDTKRLTYLYQNEEVLRFKPDLIICIGWKREGFQVPSEVPFVTWVQDKLPHLFNKDAAKTLKKHDIILVQAKRYIPVLESLGYSDVVRFPLGVNTNTYKPVKLSEADLRKYSCDVLFVGNLPETPEDALETFKQRLRHPASRDTIHTMYALIEQAFVDGTGCYGEQYEEFLAKAEHDCGFRIISAKRPLLIEHFMYKVGYAMIRVLPIRWLIENGIDVHLYGNGWDQSAEFKPFAKGFITPGVELNKLYNASRITLTHHLATGSPSSTNPLASRAFCLANNIPRPYDLEPVDPDLDKNLVTFSGKADFLNKVRYFLSNNNEREQIAEKCREIFVSRYDYSKMAQRLIDIVRERL